MMCLKTPLGKEGPKVREDSGFSLSPWVLPGIGPQITECPPHAVLPSVTPPQPTTVTPPVLGPYQKDQRPK